MKRKENIDENKRRMDLKNKLRKKEMRNKIDFLNN